MLCIYLAARHYGHVATIRILILTNCYGITNLLLQKFTFTENQTFYKIFMLQKFGAIGNRPQTESYSSQRSSKNSNKTILVM